MPVPLAWLGDTVGVWAHWSLGSVKGFCSSSGCKRNLRGTELLQWKWEMQHGLGKQGVCIPVCRRVHFFWSLHTKQWWKGRGLPVPLLRGRPGLLSLQMLVCCQGVRPAAVALPLNHCPRGSFELWFSKVAWFSCQLCLIPCSLLGTFTLFLISFSVLLLSRQIKVKLLLLMWVQNWHQCYNT